MMNTVEMPASKAAERQSADVLESALQACSRIAPLWPLQDFVAVNPFLGLTKLPFHEACQLMQRLAPGGMQMNASYYRMRFAEGAIREADLAAALDIARQLLPAHQAARIAQWSTLHLRDSLEQAATENDLDQRLLSVSESADLYLGTAWSNAIAASLGRFCAAYFDNGQSAWRSPWRDLTLYDAWREHASRDAELEILGLRGLRRFAATLPQTAEDTLRFLVPKFGLVECLEDFLHRELLTVGGWAAFAQHRVRASSGLGPDATLVFDLLVARLALDAALLDQYDGPAFREFWPAQANPNVKSSLLLFVWQLADEHAWLKSIATKLATAVPRPAAERRPSTQAVFCIDVRSEVFRRALEATDPDLRTLGFAGFFGLPIERVPFGGDHGIAQCPVLLKPSWRVRERPRGAGGLDETAALQRKRLADGILYAWNSFKTSAISCFSFVETAGLGFSVKLFLSAFFPEKPAMEHPHGCCPSLEADENSCTGITPADRITLASGALRNMGLIRDFARVVLLCGHGSATTNNPYAAGLDCGACGGHSGGFNARVAAAILNDPQVRSALVAEGIRIPDDTWFIAGLHCTTTDEVTLFDADLVPESHWRDRDELKARLSRAGAAARQDRAAKLGLSAQDAALRARIEALSADWSAVRPEWGLAGNAAFVAAPRARTRQANLEGRVFLHEYDHREDPENSTLELIMCAPMVVANWINLQYFGSTVNNALFGSGNKVLHNVTGTFGVCLGNGGDLQQGLPIQSLHNGYSWMHEPLRLHVFLEAPGERIEAVLAKHAHVRELVDNGWLLLFSIERDSGDIVRYLPGSTWEPIPSTHQPLTHS